MQEKRAARQSTSSAIDPEPLKMSRRWHGASVTFGGLKAAFLSLTIMPNPASAQKCRARPPGSPSGPFRNVGVEWICETNFKRKPRIRKIVNRDASAYLPDYGFLHDRFFEVAYSQMKLTFPAQGFRIFMMQ